MKRTKHAAAFCFAGFLVLASGGASHAAEAKIKTGPDGRAIGAYNLTPRDDCLPASVRGRVVKRDFDRRGLYLSGVIIEEADGSRAFVNVDSDYSTKDAATVGSLKGALETLLAVGKRVNLGVYGCGAAGRVMTIHSIKPL